MSWSIFLFVSSLKINETIHSIRIKQWVQQKQNITHRYGSTKKELKQQTSTIVSISHRYGSTDEEADYHIHLIFEFQSLIGTVQLKKHGLRYNLSSVSISHRYGSTTVFTAFYVFIIPYFCCFSIFFSKKVGQPLHSKFPQSLDSTGFFIFAKIDSEVHRLFDCFCCFRHFSMLFLSWRPWFYWVGGSPTFFTDFLTIFVLIKEKAPVLSQKLKLLLNISITPVIRPSPYIHALHLYSATRKISLSFGERPLTSYPGFRPSLHRIGCLQISPSIQIFPQLFLPYGYSHRLLPL